MTCAGRGRPRVIDCRKSGISSAVSGLPCARRSTADFDCKAANRTRLRRTITAATQTDPTISHDLNSAERSRTKVA